MIVAWWPFVIALIAIVGASFQIRSLRQGDARFRMEKERLRLMKARAGLHPVVEERVRALRQWVEDNGLQDRLVVDDFGHLHARPTYAEDIF